MDGRDNGDAGHIVWLEDGAEVPFEPAGPRRPWLEESAGWDDDPAPVAHPPEPPAEPPQLIWL